LTATATSTAAAAAAGAAAATSATWGGHFGHDFTLFGQHEADCAVAAQHLRATSLLRFKSCQVASHVWICICM